MAFTAGVVLLWAGHASAAPIAKQTEPPGLSSGSLANRQFLVRGKHGTGVALYFGNGSLEGSSAATRAVIIVHGVLRNADTYFATGKWVLDQAHASQTLLIAPQFVEAGDLRGRAHPARVLFWDSQWPGGAAALGPAPLSSYTVFDAMLSRLADRSRFPQLREIEVIGHSAGGQIVQRYAAVGVGPNLIRSSGINMRFVVANPSSYLYFDAWRPYRVAACPGFNRWRYGLTGAPSYINSSASRLGRAYAARAVTYLLGTADTDAHEWDLDTSCAAEAQGPYRFARGKAYIGYLRMRHPNGTSQDYAFVGGVGHDNRKMFGSACGVAVIFERSRAACAGSGKI